MGSKSKKVRLPPVDGLGPKDLLKLRTAIRKVWSWSTPRKLCIARATGPDGFPRCEKCKLKVPKVFPDHIVPAGRLDGGFIARMFVPSSSLQALCKKCHDRKTREEAKVRKREDEVEAADEDGGF